MKKRILLLFMLFSIALTKAQTVGDLFTVNDVIYDIKSLPTMTENGTVSVDATNKTYPNANLTIPISVTDPGTSTTYDIIQIESQAFINNTNITTLVVNCTTLSATFRTFENTPLQTVSIPNLTSWGNSGRIFEDCLSLTSVSIPNYSGILQNQNFFLCEDLVTVDLGNITAIGNQNFQGCTSLESINLPSLTNINNFSFANCTNLKNVSAPLATSVERAAFLNCTSLTELILPSLTTVDAVNRDPFENATNLAHIALGNATPPVITGTGSGALPAFTTLPANATLIVPEGSSAAYEGTALWTDFSIVEGTLSKTNTDITYSKNLSVDDDWFLVSSPVSNEMYNDAYVTANSIDATGTIATNNAIATYTTNGNTWDYLQDGEDLPFTPGVGYSVKREGAAGPGNISFTGSSLNSGDINNVPVSLDADGYNLLGNPYLTNINSGPFLTANGNLSGEIWLYNQATDNYENHVMGDNKVLAPVQGFFIKATSGSDVNFTTTIQTNTETGTFQKTSRSEIKLLINSEDTERFAKIYFTEAATAGYDKGWDGETFTGVANEFDVFTQLLENNTGKNYQIQSLPKTSIETTVVPVGLISEAGKKITFSAEALNLPAGLKVILEDRVNNTFTNLNDNATYKISLAKAINGIGRFYLHTTQSALSISNVVLENVSIYNTNASTLRIVGLQQGEANVKLFNVLGKQMINSSFKANGVNEISLPNLAKGVYIVQIETENGTLNKKIIL